MASHHPHGGCRCHHQSHREAIRHVPFNYAASPSCCCADSSHPPPNLDHLLRLIASYLQNQHQQQTLCSCETTSQRFNAEYDNLLRKVDDLDISFRRFAACYDDKRRHSHYSTLKDSAARVIQTHFRSYLVHRSISLRQLKELATIKSSFLSLKSSVSGKTHFPFQAVSRQATDLLLRLDSIQGRVDSMIRDGKRSLCRELVRFLRYIDDCAVKRPSIVCKDVRFMGKERRPHVGVERTSPKLRRKTGKIYVTSTGDYGNIAELEEFHFISDDAQQTPIVSLEKNRKAGSSKSRVGELVKGNRVQTPLQLGKIRDFYELTSITTEGTGGKTPVMKTVSFDENGNVYKVYGDTPETSVSGGDDSSTSGSNEDNGDEVEDIEYVPKENEVFKEEEEETHSEDEEEPSSEGSKEEEQVAGEKDQKREFQLRRGSSMFSPPLPLKMEP